MKQQSRNGSRNDLKHSLGNCITKRNTTAQEGRIKYEDKRN